MHIIQSTRTKKTFLFMLYEVYNETAARITGKGRVEKTDSRRADYPK